eukprot:CAMPEP_0198309022 /NCGR_PEP_ID=MMETSP1450-20131203/1498_1 /TAXON_ID=753684 ORGANISM="Madagascaria erythrocladiodes, Strain CCMP3234" /NCGR_SAMPLE_ID=MMETSP1450 /ASSEMBLY_ACC=CAM_ASM_001115 /LENGTH=116 /DNA_ID=CAMNT_0044011743 /DNA_START=283 /DNA_END=631 /DNA_ORIENTATION=+
MGDSGHRFVRPNLALASATEALFRVPASAASPRARLTAALASCKLSSNALILHPASCSSSLNSATSSFRIAYNLSSALVSSARVVNFAMTRLKSAISASLLTNTDPNQSPTNLCSS